MKNEFMVSLLDGTKLGVRAVLEETLESRLTVLTAKNGNAFLLTVAVACEASFLPHALLFPSREFSSLLPGPSGNIHAGSLPRQAIHGHLSIHQQTEKWQRYMSAPFPSLHPMQRRREASFFQLVQVCSSSRTASSVQKVSDTFSFQAPNFHPGWVSGRKSSQRDKSKAC